jgi:hypothetical protein
VRRLFALAWVLLANGCVASAPPAGASAAAAAAPARSTVLCADTRLSARGHVCIRPLSADEQQRRAFSARLELEGGVAVRMWRLNGRGFFEPNDDGCIEYRYRFEEGYVAESVGYRRDGTVCDRTLYRQRATTLSLVDAWGRPAFRSERLHTAMRLGFDEQGMVVNQRPLASDGSATTVQLAAELRFERDSKRLEKRACYFDEQGRAIKNTGGVHCWSYERDQFGNELERAAWDEQGKPTTASDGAHRFVKVFDRYGNLLRQTALGLDGKAVSTRTSHCPMLIYHRDEHGSLVGVDCRDGAGKPHRFDKGHAAWRGTPDAFGLQRETRYFDVDGALFLPGTDYARVELTRDRFGHVVERRFFLADGSPGQHEGPPVLRVEWNAQHLEIKRTNLDQHGGPWRHRGCVSMDYEYDRFRQPVRSTCRGPEGEPALSWDNVATTVSRYDQRGLLVETTYLDTAGKPIDSRRGYQRKLYSYDARGVDSKARHFKADGSEIQLPRFSVLWVRPPLADGFWPAHSRALALETIETARRELLAGMSWWAALTRYGDEKVYAVNPGDSGYLDLRTVHAVARDALEPLQVGEYSAIIEMPYGFALYLRTE